MSLSSDFAIRLDAELATFTTDAARRLFLQSQARTWRTRYLNFCQRPRPSDPGDVRISSQLVAEMRRGLITCVDEACIRCAVAGFLSGAYVQSTALPRDFNDIVATTITAFAKKAVQS
jgi:hypothetical protein